ncbi:hypothetical protein WISP_41160 [Willisornis vidua]|uniref:Uncharacterized protein n=1 Tax=Willisornis vidua TaxID=1566151 RepID=A0ABQ9DMJ6_9PASS|nr:hypothetical protein WISP_41160 [Willisornis vidua]
MQRRSEHLEDQNRSNFINRPRGFLFPLAPFRYWKSAIKSSQSLLISRMNSPDSLSLSLREECSIPPVILDALLDSLQQVDVFPVLGTPELGAALQIQEQILLEVSVRHMEDKEVMQRASTASLESKSCLTNLVFFYNGVTPSVDKGIAMDVIYLQFFKAMTWSPTISFSLNWREMDMMDGLFSGQEIARMVKSREYWSMALCLDEDL